jgi:hypothetical protein
MFTNIAAKCLSVNGIIDNKIVNDTLAKSLVFHFYIFIYKRREKEVRNNRGKSRQKSAISILSFLSS